MFITCAAGSAHVLAHVCEFVRYTYMHICTCVHVYIGTHVCMYICICVCVYM